MTPCLSNLREIKFTCYSEVSTPPWHSILRQLHGSPNLTSVHLNFSSRVVTDAKDFFVFLESLARQHPRVTDLLVWPHCVNNSPWLDLRSHVQSMCTHFTHLVHLNLSLGGLDSAGVITVLETLHLPSLRDFRLRISYSHVYDTQCPIQPQFPCPPCLRCLTTLHLKLGHRIPPGALQPWLENGPQCLTDLLLTFSESNTDPMTWEATKLVRRNQRTLRTLVLHNLTLNANHCDASRLAAALHLRRCTMLETLSLLQPLGRHRINHFLDEVPHTLRTLDIRVNDGGSAPSMVIHIPAFVARLRLHVPHVTRDTLPGMGWLGLPPSWWQLDMSHQTAILQGLDWVVKER